MSNLIEIKPKSSHTATVIFLHGLMDTGKGWETPIQMIKSIGGLDHIKFILPTAPSIPISINHGNVGTAWFNVMSLNPGSQEDSIGLEKSMKQIEQLIEEEIKNGIGADRIILGGFSQGGAMTLFTGYQSKYKVAALISLSGFSPSLSLPSKIKPENKDIPCTMFHGTDDKVVNFKWGELSFKSFSKVGVTNNQFIPIQNLGHSANEFELKQVHDLIEKYLPNK
ncbi:hypothetical protein RB653_007543 [Dictyostelium firmibasis]|uniref:Phospholipase/carboxylesterase/thioesterase domain-containing protein n=1 Tax=Dictyostelium firmibasis TaxID=79012 RepID=A0AAN7TWN0_9MYCE